MSRPVFFEVNVDNAERAIKFYKAVFDWKIEKYPGSEQPYWLVTTGPKEEPGIDGGITMRMMPGVATVNTIGVENLDEAVAKVTAAGGKVIAPKMEVKNVGWLAYCTDTEGNPFGMMQAIPGGMMA